MHINLLLLFKIFLNVLAMDFSVPYSIHIGPAAHHVSDTKGMRVFFPAVVK